MRFGQCCPSGERPGNGRWSATRGWSAIWKSSGPTGPRSRGNGPPDQEYVFCHPSGAPVGSFKGGFQRALKEAGVLYASDGKKRVPYSLRHTYATMRISEGVSVFQLAANMGTSVEMLEDFCGKKRMRDPKMATEVTKNGGWEPEK